MKITWFGHSAFRIDLDGAVIMIDPFIGNPTFEGDQQAAYQGTTHVVLTHGHDDHTGSTVEICKATGATLIANFEICNFLAGKGVENFSPGNHGGCIDFGAFSVTFVAAWHSSSTIGRWHSGLSRQSGRRHHQGAQRTNAAAHGRHRHFRRHGVDQPRSTSRRSASFRSATGSPWGPSWQRWRATAFSTSRPSYRATTARFRSSTRRPTRLSPR